MKNLNKWSLTDNEGNVILEGRKKDVEIKAYHRYVYEHIFSDCIYRTNEKLAN